MATGDLTSLSASARERPVGVRKETRTVTCEPSPGGYRSRQKAQLDLSNPYMTGLAFEVENTPEAASSSLVEPIMKSLGLPSTKDCSVRPKRNPPTDSSSESDYSAIPDVSRDYYPVSTPETVDSPDYDKWNLQSTVFQPPVPRLHYPPARPNATSRKICPFNDCGKSTKRL